MKRLDWSKMRPSSRPRIPKRQRLGNINRRWLHAMLGAALFLWLFGYLIMSR